MTYSPNTSYIRIANTVNNVESNVQIMSLPEFSLELHQLLAEYLDSHLKLRSDSNKFIGSISLIQDFENCSPKNSDKFFETYGVGNWLYSLDRPYDRMRAYEKLLHILKIHDPQQYNKLHKGVPFFFIAWTAFQSGDFEKGLFYLDAAVSEDLRRQGSNFNINASEHSPAISFLLLVQTEELIGLDLFTMIVTKVSEAITRFNKVTGYQLTIETFSEKFLKGVGLFENGSFRTIVTSFYSFIVEFDLRTAMLELRSTSGGSLEPFLTHLFKGCLILETILKLKPPADTASTLGKAIQVHEIKLNINRQILPKNVSMRDIVNGLNQLAAQNEDYQNICFYVAYGIRNTTGHKLSWADIFLNDPKIYAELYNRIIGAIMWSIYKLWI